MILTREEVKKMTYGTTFRKGEELYREGAVGPIREEEEPDFMGVSAYVMGSRGFDYHVWLGLDLKYGEIRDYECECPAFFQYDAMCKHCVALALHYVQKTPQQLDLEQFLRSGKKKEKKAATDIQVSKLIYDCSMEEMARYLQPDVSGRIELEPRLHRDFGGFSLSFRVGAEAKYVVKDLFAFLESFEKREKVDYGKKLGFIHEPGVLTSEAREMLEFLQKYVGAYRHYREKEMAYRYGGLPAMRALPLSEQAMGAFFHLMVGKQIRLEEGYGESSILEVVAEDPELTFQLEEMQEKKGFRFTLPSMEAFYGDGRLYVRYRDRIYECSREYSADMGKICQLGSLNRTFGLPISQEDMRAFCSAVLPLLQKHTELLADANLQPYLPIDCTVKIYLDCGDGIITAKLEAEYGDQVYNLLEPVRVQDAFRNARKESAAVRVAEAYFDWMTEDGCFALEEKREERLYHLVTTGIPQLQEVGELYISEALKRIKVSVLPKISVGVSLSQGLIDLTVDSGDLPAGELQEFLASYRKKKKFYRLKDGSFMELENASMSMMSELMDGLSLKEKDFQEGSIQIPKYQAFYLNQVLKEEAEGIEVSRNQAFKAVIRDMKAVEDSDYEVPDSLKNILRPYQKTGFRWLCTLEALGFGGILADDMGLGKTIQAIAFLLYQKQRGKTGPSLIVCPASLVYNWQSECVRFAGEELSVLAVAGNQSERKAQIQACREYDLVITSYDLLKRDAEEYQNQSFYAMMIDEAQNIKNHATQAAKAVKSIKAQVRFALTGTPIENRLSELWSIFDFLMPGFLGAYERFKKEYEVPIVQKKDSAATTRLQRMIKPFILRRIKAEVLKDLPPKEENVVYSKLEGEQKKLYAANVQRLLDSLSQKSEQEIGSSKLQILAELTRLRQICCAPGMVYEDYRGESAKLDTCMELLRNAMEGGHKVLLFSQFTSLFTLLEERLKKEKMSYLKLTGATSKTTRMELVRQFNDPEGRDFLFLISLKAGGTGLNLTAADIVIHFDPWWNAAAQNQATDRAHRIGQTNPVTVFKLIARDTIEEKIIKLQEAKRDLSDQIIAEGGVSVSDLTKEDFMGLLEP